MKSLRFYELPVMGKKGMASIPIRTRGNKISKKGVLAIAVMVIGGTMMYKFGGDLYDSKVSPWLASSTGIGVSAAEAQSAATVTQATAVQQGANPELIGKASTVTVKTYDLENNDPTTVIYPVTAAYMQPDKAMIKAWDGETSITNLVVGNIIDLYGGNESYFVDPKMNLAITNEQTNIELDGHTLATETNLAVTCYDNTGSTELTAAAAPDGDYNITLGSGQEKVIYCKLANNGANGLFPLKTVCTATINEIQTLEVDQTDWTKDIVSSELGGLSMHYGDGTASTLSNDSWSGCYTYKKGTNEYIALHEWDEEKLKFKIAAKTASDPAYGGSHAAGNDVAAILFKDGSWNKGSDKMPYFDYYQHISTEPNVGISEDELRPQGKTTGVVIVGI